MNNIQSYKWDLVCISETHLLTHINSSFVNIPGYSLFRHDVHGFIAKHGVCCYVKSDILVGDVTAPIPGILTLHLVSFNVFVVVVYRAPSSTPEANTSMANFVGNFGTEKEIIFLGDFNLPSIDWTDDELLPKCSTDSSFLEAFGSLGLTQWVKEPTFPRSGNILDLILTSESDRIGRVEVLCPLPGCDHCPTTLEYIFSGQLQASRSLQHKRAWHKGDYKALCKELSEVDWGLELAYLSTNEAYNVFSNHLRRLTQAFVPLKPSSTKGVKPPWETRPPRSLVEHRQKAWANYKAVRQRLGRRSLEATSALSVFTGLNKQMRNFAVHSQVLYESKLMHDSKANPKLIHSHIRRKKVGCPTIGPLKLRNNFLTDDPQLMADKFVESFSTVFSRGCPINPSPHQTFHGSLSDIEITAGDVLTVLSHLDVNSAAGPDEIHPVLLKKCASQLAYPLHVIFCRSLRDGKLPDAWKTSLVTPIFKKGQRYDPLNYRPISVTSVPGKCMERLVCNYLTSYLEDNLLLSHEQFGFRAGRSTQDQLLMTYDFVSDRVDRGHAVDVILFDFSKAFDVVIHNLLIDKLRYLGVQGAILLWITDFLCGRTMRVRVKGHISKPTDVLSGVPQGSILGPVLFLIFINCIASQLKCKYKIFADDLKIYAPVDHNYIALTTSVTQSIQEDIDVLHSTALSWGLQINVKKSVVLRFPHSRPDLDPPTYTLDGLPLPTADTAVDLGVTVDTKLKFHSHAQATAHKASGLSHSLLKATVCRSKDFMLFLLKTHIRPVLEYSSCLWNTGYLTDLQLLEKVQRRWTKQIEGLRNIGYAERLTLLDLYSVQGRLLRADLIQYWKILNGKSCIAPSDIFQLSPETRTRGHPLKLYCPPVQTDVRKRSFSRRLTLVWNSLPGSVACAPDLGQFKRMLHDSIHDLLYEYTE